MHGIDEANALVLQHVRSLHVRDDLANLLQQELERASRDSPRSKLQGSSLVQLVGTLPDAEAIGSVPIHSRSTTASGGGKRKAPERDEPAAPEDEASGRSPLLFCCRRPVCASGSSCFGAATPSDLAEALSTEKTEDSEDWAEDDCSGDGGAAAPPTDSVGLIKMPPLKGLGRTVDFLADGGSVGSPGDACSPQREAGEGSPGLAAKGAARFARPVHREPFTETTNMGVPVSGDPGLSVSMVSSPGSPSSWSGPRAGEQVPGLHAAFPLTMADRLSSSVSTASCIRPPVSVPVMLHVYDLGESGSSRTLNSVLSLFRVGVFHCGVEVYGREWSFRKCVEGSGVFSCRPRLCQGQSYAESVLMGQTVLPKCDVLRLIHLLGKKWLGPDYNTLTRNCCHFCKEFCRLLNVGDVPEYITAAASAGQYLEDTTMSVRAIIMRRLRERTCCGDMLPPATDLEEDLPETVPTLALPSNTASPSQAVPARLQESLMEEYSRMSRTYTVV
mmetsp:Transcript_29375/g.92743  ORF Transcript_29375/g.92743 Transcript_29375/m.92743 type:complete len:502 (+) Transcript_29375:40-1545(+)